MANNLPLEVAEQLILVKYNNYNKLLRNGRERELRYTLLDMWEIAKTSWLKGAGHTFYLDQFNQNHLDEMFFRGWLKRHLTTTGYVIWLANAGKRVLGIEV